MNTIGVFLRSKPRKPGRSHSHAIAVEDHPITAFLRGPSTHKLRHVGSADHAGAHLDGSPRTAGSADQGSRAAAVPLDELERGRRALAAFICQPSGDFGGWRT